MMEFPVSEPADGYDQLERAFLRQAVCTIYRSIESPIDKFIFMATQEAGYTQEDVAMILSCSTLAVYKRMKRIKRSLRSKRAELDPR